MKSLSDLLVVIAGADPEDLRDSTVERARYAVMGLSVCATALFATAAIPAALAIATGRFSYIYLIFGALWGLFVFNLDRWVVTIVDYKSLRSDLSAGAHELVLFSFRKIALLIVRLAIAMLIGLSISEPIVMLVYSAEINVQIGKDQAAQIAAAATEIDKDPQYVSELSPFQQTLDAITKVVNQDQVAVKNANDALDAEENGTGGSHRVGAGPRAAERTKDLARANNKLTADTKDLSSAQQAYDTEQQKIASEKAAALVARTKEIKTHPGLLARERALSELSAQNETVNLARWALRGLILLVDVTPVLLKLASPATTYEKLLRIRAVRKLAAAEGELADDIEADVRIAGFARSGRVYEAEKEAAALVELIDERIRRDIRRRLRELIDDDPAEIASGSIPPALQSVPATLQLTVGDTPAGPVDLTDTDWPSPAGRNVLGAPGSGIHQYVADRWKIGRQIPNADRTLNWRTPYLALDRSGRFQGVAALKKVHPPDQVQGTRDAQQEVTSLPQGIEVSPYVAEVIQSGLDRDFGWFVVTPYYRNGTLQKRIEAKPPLTLSQALTIAEQVLQGLFDAFTYESKSLVHMDIKPPNIAFDDEGRVRIIDWGLSTALNPDYQLSVSDSPRYTMWYAPPEQVMPPDNHSLWISPACDIRAVGAVCYTMITGRPPLYLEAFTAGMIDDSGYLKRAKESEFMTEMLSQRQPIPLSEFFAATEWRRAEALHGLSDLVGSWLDPTPSGRIIVDGEKPSQQTACEALRRVIEDLRSQASWLLSNEVGLTRIQRPDQRVIGRRAASRFARDRVRPDASTVAAPRNTPNNSDSHESE